tara:strand:- start:6932 stop:7915 length:984 start_codon:yes stop_codon:yes gene_type:complete
MLLYQLAINVQQVLSVLKIVLSVNGVNWAKCLKTIPTVNTVSAASIKTASSVVETVHRDFRSQTMALYFAMLVLRASTKINQDNTPATHATADNTNQPPHSQTAFHAPLAMSPQQGLQPVSCALEAMAPKTVPVWGVFLEKGRCRSRCQEHVLNAPLVNIHPTKFVHLALPIHTKMWLIRPRVKTAGQIVIVRRGPHFAVTVLLAITPLRTIPVSIVCPVNIVVWTTQKTNVLLVLLVSRQTLLGPCPVLSTVSCVQTGPRPTDRRARVVPLVFLERQVFVSLAPLDTTKIISAMVPALPARLSKFHPLAVSVLTPAKVVTLGCIQL